MLATLQGSRMANPKSLKDKARGKCLICTQAGHWAKECPNHGKSPKTACYKCHQLRHWAAICPEDPRASRSGAKPSFTMVQQDWSSLLQPACLSQITITGLEPRVQLDVAGRSGNSWLTWGLPTLSWSPTLEPSPPKPVPLCEKKLLKDSPEHLFVAGLDKYFPTGFWWSLNVLLPYWEEIILTKLGTTLVMGSFSAPRALQVLVTTEEPITPSPIERDQKLWAKLTPRCGTRGLLDETTKLNWSSLSSEIPLSFLTRNNTPSEESLRRDYSL